MGKLIVSETTRMADLTKTQRDMIELGGRVCQLLGIPRSTGQIYGLLFLSAKALSLDDFVAALGISKASASTGTRLLLAWRTIRVSWVPGERRDFFEIDPDIANLLRIHYRDVIQRRFLTAQSRVQTISASLEEEQANGLMSTEDYAICSERLKAILEIQKKVQELLPLLEKLL